MTIWLYESVDAFAVIADPTRRRILDALRGGSTDVGELVARLDISQSLASKHLAVLRNAGAVDVRGGRQTARLPAGRGSPARVLAWVTPFHRKWSMSLDRLTDLIDEEQS